MTLFSVLNSIQDEIDGNLLDSFLVPNDFPRQILVSTNPSDIMEDRMIFYFMFNII